MKAVDELKQRRLFVVDPIKKAIDKKTGLKSDKVVHFSEGLPAFEEVKDFVLINNKEEAPFLWIQAVSMPELAFVAIDPFLICPDYRPEITETDLKSLKVNKKEDVLILSIVNMKDHKAKCITTNLVGVILINWKEKLGKQAIIKNHQSYSIKYAVN
ncbi:Flagellar assembly factor FliW [Chlamydiales bacterium SCGC AB-751-O23]|jgi:flagellar assembly factor FliW|nr:Flagellar assembly factor FliW [Chlamydiales bacterium SCGC AB-751-O23]